MKEYLTNILPRIKEYSKTLNKKESFVDYPWVYIDENGHKQTYIFKRNGELLISDDGSVSVGNWELLPRASAILIDRGKDKLLLKQEFIDEAVMALKIDSQVDVPFILINTSIIQDGNVEAYISRKYFQSIPLTSIDDNFEPIIADNHRVDFILLMNGDKLHITRTKDNSLIGGSATINKDKPIDGEYRSFDQIYTIAEGKITNIRNSPAFILVMFLLALIIFLVFIVIVINR